MNYHNHELNVKFVQHHQAQRHQEAEKARMVNFAKAAANETTTLVNETPVYGVILARIGQWMQNAGERLQTRYGDLTSDPVSPQHSTPC